MKINEVVVEGFASGLVSTLGSLAGFFDPEMAQKLKGASADIKAAGARNERRLTLDDGQTLTKKGNAWVDELGKTVASSPAQVQALDKVYNDTMKQANLGNVNPQRGPVNPKLMSPVDRTIAQGQQAAVPAPAAPTAPAPAAPAAPAAPVAPAPAAAPAARPLAQKLKQQRGPKPKYST